MGRKDDFKLTPEGNQYSYQYLIFFKNPVNFTSHEQLLKACYELKWANTHHDGSLSRLHTIFIAADDKLNDPKFECLKHADQYSRMTIIGHHKLGAEYFCHDITSKIHYTKIINVIRENVVSNSVLLSGSAFDPSKDRSLRITFLACNVGVNTSQASLAEKMFDYACNHKNKPLRIEMSAPLMFCGPMLFPKNVEVNRFRLPKDKINPECLHKRYGTLPYHRGKFFLFGKSGGLWSFISPKYRPGNHKKILKIDNQDQRPVKAKVLKPEQDNPGYHCK